MFNLFICIIQILFEYYLTNICPREGFMTFFCFGKMVSAGRISYYVGFVVKVNNGCIQIVFCFFYQKSSGNNSLLVLNIKGYLCYKTITSQSVPSKAQIKNFFIS